ncbi:MAG TPA: toll/interleukin-1 receptor domain-containing protein [Bacteroidia bacterium]|nr:toll/interleukin-1 receptor domain-containing protein [Bacteroidia bacterium]
MMFFKKYKWDAFICHATEDKETIVDSFVLTLKNQGLKVWYDKECIKDWDNFKDEIMKAIPQSRVLVFVLSKIILEPEEKSPKKWPWIEIGKFLTNKNDEYLLTLLYGITNDELKRYDIPDFFRTRKIPTLHENNIVDKSTGVSNKVRRHKTKGRKQTLFFVFLILFGVLSIPFLNSKFNVRHSQPPKTIPIKLRVIDNKGNFLNGINLIIDEKNYYIAHGENCTVNIPNNDQEEITLEFMGNETYSPAGPRRTRIDLEENILPPFVIEKRITPLPNE